MDNTTTQEVDKLIADLKAMIDKMKTVEGSESYDDDGEIYDKMKSPRAKVQKFSIKTHNSEGEEVVTKELVVAISNKYKSIKRYALILHDKDNYNQEDALLYNHIHPGANRQAGDHKDDHIHWVAEFGTNQSVEMVAKWFGIPANLIKVAKGRGAFLDCVEYLTHEHEKQQQKGKHLYSDDEVISNFDWRDELNKKNEKKLRYGREDVDIKHMLRYEVAYNGMTLKQVREQYRFEYMDDIDTLRKLRRDYLKSRPTPTFKLNMYIGGIDGGIGKGLMGKAIAKNIVDPADVMEDDEIWFKVTPKNRFNGYNGQHVLIWEDYRPLDLLNFFDGDRGALFKLIEPHQSSGDGMVDIKYDNIKLLNCINIFDCIEEPEAWLNALAGEYKKADGTVVKSEAKQKGQVFRRFPITFWIVEDNFSIRVNRGVLNGTREYLQYEQSEKFRGNLQQLVTKLSPSQYKQVSAKMIQPAIETVNAVKSKIDTHREDLPEEELERLYGDWGKPIVKQEQVEPKQLIIETDEEGNIVVPDDIMEDPPFY